MELLTANISDLVLDPANPRDHPAENIEAIKASLARFGQVLPLLVRNSDCQVVAGNGTLQAMLQLGWDQCQVALYDGSDAECRALSVALNRTAELAEWNEDNLAKAVADLGAGGFDGMHAIGFSGQELGEMVFGFVGIDSQKETDPVAEADPAVGNGNGMRLMATCPRCGCEFAPSGANG